jgi:hypothetical protein
LSRATLSALLQFEPARRGGLGHSQGSPAM